MSRTRQILSLHVNTEQRFTVKAADSPRQACLCCSHSIWMRSLTELTRRDVAGSNNFINNVNSCWSLDALFAEHITANCFFPSSYYQYQMFSPRCHLYGAQKCTFSTMQTHCLVEFLFTAHKIYNFGLNVLTGGLSLPPFLFIFPPKHFSLKIVFLGFFFFDHPQGNKSSVVQCSQLESKHKCVLRGAIRASEPEKRWGEKSKISKGPSVCRSY